MMWSGARSEVTEMPELSEPEWCWYSSCVENCVNECRCRALWVCWDLETKKCPDMALAALPEQDAELVLFLLFKYNKTLQASCFLCPVQSRCLNLYIFL